jgi:hypothetical protein
LNRWVATIFYRGQLGLIDVTHEIEELEDLQDIVEQGPHWDTIERIDILRIAPTFDKLTLEEADKL